MEVVSLQRLLPTGYWIVFVLDVILQATTCGFAIVFLLWWFFGLKLTDWAFVVGLLCMLKLSVLGIFNALCELFHKRRSQIEES
jgi:hypothetical protein